jgi:hypothetical protein
MNHSEQNLPQQAILGVLSGKSGENPFPLFAQMREMGSVIPIPFPLGGSDNQAWIVTHMEEAIKVLKDNDHFCRPP